MIDLSPSAQYEVAHVPGTWNIPLSMLAAWAGWLVDYGRPVYLIGKRDSLGEAIRVLHKIGVDEIAGYFDAEAIEAAGLASEHYKSASPTEIADQIASGAVRLIDVRSKAEWNEGFIPKAEHVFLGRLPENLNQVCHRIFPSSRSASVVRDLRSQRAFFRPRDSTSSISPEDTSPGNAMVWQRRSTNRRDVVSASTTEPTHQPTNRGHCNERDSTDARHPGRMGRTQRLDPAKVRCHDVTGRFLCGGSALRQATKSTVRRGGDCFKRDSRKRECGLAVREPRTF